MWIKFESIDFRDDLESKKGEKYSAWVLTGTKKGWKDEPDTPGWSKILFENKDIATVHDKSGDVEMDAVEFFRSCEEGDLVAVKQSQNKDGFWSIVELENKTRSVVSNGDGVSTQSPAASLEGPDTLVAATVFVNALVLNGHYKEETSPEVLLDAVNTYRMRMDGLFTEEALVL